MSSSLRQGRRMLGLGLAAGCIAVCLGLGSGCRSTASKRETDSRLTRLTKDGRKAFAEGDLERSERHYRLALYRAWAMDDPYESGTAAYNLAAVLTSHGHYADAENWLMEARAELCRGDASLANAWLLASLIAEQTYRYEDAARYVQLARQSDPPCQDGYSDVVTGCLCRLQRCGSGNCIGNVLDESRPRSGRRSEKACQQEFDALTQLELARIAAKQYDIDTAATHFRQAIEVSRHNRDELLLAHFQHVAGLIHLARGEFLSAARHFDQEAQHWRQARIYRDVPLTLELSARAYEQSERFDLAAVRMLRVAKILIGRGEAESAWVKLQVAIELASAAGKEPLLMRATLIASEIEALANSSQDATPISPEGESLIEDTAARTTPTRTNVVSNEGLIFDGFDAPTRAPTTSD